MKQILYLMGDKQGEHLRMEIEGGEVVLWSRDLIPGRIQNQWRNRLIFAMDRATLKRITDAL